MESKDKKAGEIAYLQMEVDSFREDALRIQGHIREREAKIKELGGIPKSPPDKPAEKKT